MRYPIVIIGSLFSNFLLFAAFGYAQNFTWMNGGNVLNPPVVHGTQGLSSPSNSPGGRGYSTSYYQSNTGNLWLFGGWRSPLTGNNSTYALDLWKYNTLTNQWTWVKGSSTPDLPGVYGTKGVSSPNNYPGGRIGAVLWLDTANNLWLFGGFGFSSNSFGSMNDMWKYNIGTNEWTWMHGSNASDSYGFHGIQGTGTSSTTPSARHGAKGFTDSLGNLYLFGGMVEIPLKQTPLNRTK